MAYPNDPMDQVLPGMEVYSSDGERIGKVAETGRGVRALRTGEQVALEEQGYFRVERPSGPDLYVPGEHTQEVGAGRVTLALASDAPDLEGMSEAPGSSPA